MTHTSGLLISRGSTVRGSNENLATVSIGVVFRASPKSDRRFEFMAITSSHVGCSLFSSESPNSGIQPIVGQSIFTGGRGILDCCAEESAALPPFIMPWPFFGTGSMASCTDATTRFRSSAVQKRTRVTELGAILSARNPVFASASAAGVAGLQLPGTDSRVRGSCHGQDNASLSSLEQE